jgi:hypothetical protein
MLYFMAVDQSEANADLWYGSWKLDSTVDYWFPYLPSFTTFTILTVPFKRNYVLQVAHSKGVEA